MLRHSTSLIKRGIVTRPAKKQVNVFCRILEGQILVVRDRERGLRGVSLGALTAKRVLKFSVADLIGKQPANETVEWDLLSPSLPLSIIALETMSGSVSICTCRKKLSSIKMNAGNYSVV